MLATTIVTPLYGKLGDLFGRKVVLQRAIALFLIGSALCGLAHSMGALIVFRAIQGLGGGGLMVTTMVGYQGVFGFSTVSPASAEQTPSRPSDCCSRKATPAAPARS
jgi:MFS family permease